MAGTSEIPYLYLGKASRAKHYSSHLHSPCRVYKHLQIEVVFKLPRAAKAHRGTSKANHSAAGAVPKRQHYNPSSSPHRPAEGRDHHCNDRHHGLYDLLPCHFRRHFQPLGDHLDLLDPLYSHDDLLHHRQCHQDEAGSRKAIREAIRGAQFFSDCATHRPDSCRAYA
jgi:hypothetical protein